MNYWQQIIIFFFGLASFTSFSKGLYECKVKKNAYGLTYPLFVVGSFVWGDAVIFGIFWAIVSIVTILLNDWILFWLIFFVFWAVRSHGEAIYYFNQQFSKVVRQPPEKLPLYSIFQNDSIWFVYQIMMQCITVVSVIASIYLTHLWLKTL